ncbi:MAG: hypothetical protein K2X36_00510 [Microbacteriaceae bacterium]|nr:hypothetical protein [Microbacteriaceae bacterium]
MTALLRQTRGYWHPSGTRTGWPRARAVAPAPDRRSAPRSARPSAGATTEIAAISPSLGGDGSLADWVRTVRHPVGNGVVMVADARTAIAKLQVTGSQR